MSLRNWCLYTTLALVGSQILCAEQIYFNDFEGAIGSEWTSAPKANSTALTSFLGYFSDNGGSSVPGSTTLTLSIPTAGTYSLIFDFYALDSWDGTRTDHNNGPDYFEVIINGQTSFHENFCNSMVEPGNDQYQTYPEPVLPRINYGGFNAADGIYQNITIPFSSLAGNTQITFQGHLLSEFVLLSDESWGIDNVRIIPEPATIGLFALGGLTFLKRKNIILSFPA